MAISIGETGWADTNQYQLGIGNTRVSQANLAATDGTIDTVTFRQYSNVEPTLAKAGCFDELGASLICEAGHYATLSTSWTDYGSAGGIQVASAPGDFTAFSCSEGAYAGIYVSAASLDAASSGGAGLLTGSGDLFDEEDHVFTPFASYLLKLTLTGIGSGGRVRTINIGPGLPHGIAYEIAP